MVKANKALTKPFGCPDFNKIERRKKNKIQRLRTREQQEEADEEALSDAIDNCHAVMKRMKERWPGRFEFPELYLYSYRDDSTSLPDEIVDQTDHWDDKREALEKQEQDLLLEESNPFTHSGRTTPPSSHPPTPIPDATTGQSSSNITNSGTTTAGDLPLPPSHHNEIDTSLSRQQEQTSNLLHQQVAETPPTSPSLNSADQQSLRNLFQGYGVVVHSPPHNRDGQLTIELQTQFDEQLHKLQGVLGRVATDSMSSVAQRVAIQSLIARNCWTTMLGLIRTVEPTFNTLQELTEVPLTEITKAVRYYLHKRSTQQRYWQSDTEKLISLAIKFVQTINKWQVTRSALTEVQTQVYLAHLQSPYVEDPTFTAKHFPNGFNQVWAERVHHCFKQQKDTVGHNFYNFKMRLDAPLSEQTEASQAYLADRYTLARMWSQTTQFLEQAEKFVCQFSCFAANNSSTKGIGHTNRTNNGHTTHTDETPAPTGLTKSKRKRGKGKSSQQTDASTSGQPTSVVSTQQNVTKSKDPNCNRCGNFHNNLKRQCAFVTKHHPDVNPNPQVLWSESAKGKQYKAQGKTSRTRKKASHTRPQNP